MLNDLMEPHAGKGVDPIQELEGREGAEDFGDSPLWQRAAETPEGGNASEAMSPPAQLTLSQALNLLEVETAKRHRAEEGMREKEERFRQMSRYLGKFLWLSDALTNKLIYVSPGYEQIWHTKREACYTCPDDWLAETPPEIEGQNPDLSAQIAKEKASNDYQAVGPDGSLRWIRERMYPIQDAAGKTLYTLGIAEDITDLKSLEAAFEKGEVIKRAFLRLVPDTVLKLLGDGTIVEFRAAKDDPDLRPHIKLRGKNLKDLLSEPMARQAIQSIQRALSTGRTQSLLLQYPVAGVPRDFEVRGVACGEDTVLALARDVSAPPQLSA
jgi:PAS domain S-box-containing protein